MQTARSAPPEFIFTARTIWWNLPPAGLGAHSGSLSLSPRVRDGHPVAAPQLRGALDRYIVTSGDAAASLWWSPLAHTLSPERFEVLLTRMQAHAADQELFVQDVYAGTDASLRLSVRIVTETAAHSLFARTAFITPNATERLTFQPDFTLLDLPTFHAGSGVDGTRGDGFVALHFGQRLGLIGGALDTRELGQALLTVMHDRLPRRGVLSLQAAANVGTAGDVAVFLGPPGSGKTTLGADPDRRMIADDELGWSDQGIFNLEGGSPARFVRPDRGAQPTVPTGHPATIVMLAADPCGVLPAASLLTPHQAVYLFLSGYGAPPPTGSEPGEGQAWFSPCCGAPLLARRPGAYAHLLGDRLAQHGTRLYLINTGWLGGPPGYGRRVPIEVSRVLVRAALDGTLEAAPTRRDHVFGFQVPLHVSGVPDDLLRPRDLWPSAEAHDAQARDLARQFREHFQAYTGDVSPAVRAAAPVVEPASY